MSDERKMTAEEVAIFDAAHMASVTIVEDPEVAQLRADLAQARAETAVAVAGLREILSPLKGGEFIANVRDADVIAAETIANLSTEANALLDVVRAAKKLRDNSPQDNRDVPYISEVASDEFNALMDALSKVTP